MTVPNPIERGRLLFAQECRFIAGAAAFERLPPSRLPEIAFAGRSNVGKSSLINALTGQKVLARTSRTPGRTRQINIFRLGERLVLADLPGYGFARVAKTEARAWNDLIVAYLRERPALVRVILLIDARRGPMPADDEVMGLLDRAGISYQLVLTKADKVGAAELAAAEAAALAATRAHAAAYADIVTTSAKTALGIPELRSGLAALIAARRNG